MNKYVMQKSSTRPDGWVLTDTENKVVITFEDGLFNESQKVTLLENSSAPQKNSLTLWVLWESGQLVITVASASIRPTDMKLVKTKRSVIYIVEKDHGGDWKFKSPR